MLLSPRLSQPLFLLLAQLGIIFCPYHADCRYFPIVLEECRKVDILDDMRERGLETLAGLQWRNLKGERLAELRGMMGSEGGGKMIFLGQHSLAEIILEHI